MPTALSLPELWMQRPVRTVLIGAGGTGSHLFGALLALDHALRALAHVFHLIDKLLVDGLVNAAGFLPRAIAHGLKPSQGGVLQGYAVGMASGIAFLLVVILVMVL